MEINLSEYFGTLTAMAGTILLLTGYISTHILKTLNSTGKQILSWGVAIGAGFFADWMDWGMFVGEGPVSTLLNSLAAGLVANGLFDVKLVQVFLEALKAKLGK